MPVIRLLRGRLTGGKLSELDSYGTEGGETKVEILQNLAEFQFSRVSNKSKSSPCLS